MPSQHSTRYGIFDMQLTRDQYEFKSVLHSIDHLQSSELIDVEVSTTLHQQRVEYLARAPRGNFHWDGNSYRINIFENLKNNFLVKTSLFFNKSYLRPYLHVHYGLSIRTRLYDDAVLHGKHEWGQKNGIFNRELLLFDREERDTQIFVTMDDVSFPKYLINP